MKKTFECDKNSSVYSYLVTRCNLADDIPYVKLTDEIVNLLKEYGQCRKNESLRERLNEKDIWYLTGLIDEFDDIGSSDAYTIPYYCGSWILDNDKLFTIKKNKLDTFIIRKEDLNFNQKVVDDFKQKELDRLKVMVNKNLIQVKNPNEITDKVVLVDNFKDVNLDDCIAYFGTVAECMRVNTFYKDYSYKYTNKISFNNIEVTDFLPPLGDMCLNFNDSYFKTVSQLDNTDMGKFCRSNSGLKTWTGQLLDESILYVLHDKIPRDTMMFLAPKKEFNEFEYRCWVHNGNLIAYDTYSVTNKDEILHTNEITKLRLKLFVERCDRLYSPDEYYVVDICEANGELKVMEYNAFSSSGFYYNIESVNQVFEYTYDSVMKSGKL